MLVLFLELFQKYNHVLRKGIKKFMSAPKKVNDNLINIMMLIYD